MSRALFSFSHRLPSCMPMTESVSARMAMVPRGEQERNNPEDLTPERAQFGKGQFQSNGLD